MLVIGRLRYCNNNWLGGSCLTLYPYLSKCCKFLFYYASRKLRSYALDDFTRTPNAIVSVMSHKGKLLTLLFSVFIFKNSQTKGMRCTLYSASGCAGPMVDLPIGQPINIADLNFAGMAKSTMCIGAI
jgi:hypothetical protein